ncbi:flagellar protein FliT [Undibacterium sp. Ji50W]|uniref:flagellar protein FliT n=1 Tax=Undibacterium sp. Ji50W TaxID=3413041 RepID=UPI003BF23935
MNSLELITLYENVATITGNMLEAARSRDWELLGRLESDCSSRVQLLRENEIPSDLPADMRDKKIRIIKQILADDKEIRDITEPWMAQLSDMMKSSSTSQKLSRAYGAGNSA